MLGVEKCLKKERGREAALFTNLFTILSENLRFFFSVFIAPSIFTYKSIEAVERF